MWRRRGPIDESDAAEKFRTAFFIRFALADIATVAGFALFFSTGGFLAVNLVGMSIGLLGLVLMVPTTTSLEGWDRRHQGALTRPPIAALLDEGTNTG